MGTPQSISILGRVGRPEKHRIVEGARVGTSRWTCVSRASLMLPCSEAPPSELFLSHYLVDTFDPSLPGSQHPADQGSFRVSSHAVIQQTWSFCRAPGTMLGCGEPHGPVLANLPSRRSQGPGEAAESVSHTPCNSRYQQSRGETGSPKVGHPLPTSQPTRCHGLSPESRHAGNRTCHSTVVGPQAQS